MVRRVIAILPCAVACVVVAAMQPRAAAPARHDLSGTWANTILTPLERPKTLGDRPFFTEQEAKEFESPDRVFERWQAARDPEEARINTEIISPYADTERRRIGADRRASLIVDPADGRLPVRTPDARRR